METQRQYRQGDFFFVEVSDIPAEAVTEKRDGGKAIVGYGEATGHHHAIAKRDAAIRELEGVRWLVAPLRERLLRRRTAYHREVRRTGTPSL